MNRSLLAIGVCLGCMVQSVMAQSSCSQPIPTCSQAIPPCSPQAPPCPPPQNPRDIPPENPRDVPRDVPTEQIQETGVYVAPPRTGTYRGPVSRTGIEGMSITLPSLKIKMPSIELPCFYHSRSEARMMIDEAEAPYTVTGYQRTVSQPPQASRDVGQDESSPRGTEDSCAQELEKLKSKYEQLEQRASQLADTIDYQRRLIEQNTRSFTPPQPQCYPPVQTPNCPPSRQTPEHLPKPTPVHSGYQASPAPIVVPANFSSPIVYREDLPRRLPPVYE